METEKIISAVFERLRATADEMLENREESKDAKDNGVVRK